MFKNIILLLLAVILLKSIVETFAAVGTEVWQSTRVNRPTRNMSYDIRGQPPSARFDPRITLATSPWGISSLGSFRSSGSSNSYLNEKEFKSHSIGLTLPKNKTIEKGYLKGWPLSEETESSWVNPILLNNEKRWGFYNLY